MAEEQQADGEGPDRSLQQVRDPAKLVRIGTMIRSLHQEARDLALDSTSRHRLRQIYDEAVKLVAEAVDTEVEAELERLTPQLAEDAPTEAEMRLAQAQLVGWLEGIFQGIQAGLNLHKATIGQDGAELQGERPDRKREDQQSLDNPYL